MLYRILLRYIQLFNKTSVVVRWWCKCGHGGVIQVITPRIAASGWSMDHRYGITPTDGIQNFKE